LRAYAAELAAETDGPTERAEALARLLDYYLATASSALDAIAPDRDNERPKPPVWSGEVPPLTDAGQALRWLDAERDTLLELAHHGDQEFVVDLSTILWRYLFTGGHIAEAIGLITEELRAALALGDPRAESRARTHLSTCLSRAGKDPELAFEHVQRALFAAQQAGDAELEAPAVNSLGLAYARRGEFTEAARHFERSLELANSTGSWAARRAALVNLHNCMMAIGRFEEALRYAEDARAVCEEVDDETNLSNAHMGIAEAWRALGRDDRAREHAERSLDLARRTGYRAVESDALCLLGSIARDAGDHEQATRHQAEALGLARILGATDNLVTRLNELASTHTAAGRPDEALLLHREALAVATEGGHRKEQADTHAHLAVVHADLGEHEAVHEHRGLALALYEELGLPRAEEMRALLSANPA
ncbi:tetratricopeptide repeat protein, partial [Streptomyces sp. 4N509B]|uniref:tetratricopeptide repeat protein n=1 Tax=Streptomyces sp. 4N509B TaxID=3457413 RepID=UPI003FD601D4